MASAPGVLLQLPNHKFLETGFWNYLREDITFSLFEQCPLKMDLESAAHLIDPHRGSPNYLNSITLILGRLLNIAFAHQAEDSEWVDGVDTIRRWYQDYPTGWRPFSKMLNGATISVFPEVWFLQPSHGQSHTFSPSC